MIPLIAITAGVLAASAIYLMLSGNMQRIAIGFILLSNGINLGILASASPKWGSLPPLIGLGSTAIDYTDPLPHAFVLTAIVIGFGTAAFLLSFGVRVFKETNSDEINEEQVS